MEKGSCLVARAFLFGAGSPNQNNHSLNKTYVSPSFQQLLLNESNIFVTGNQILTYKG
jgi:hypothetical protein